MRNIIGKYQKILCVILITSNKSNWHFSIKLRRYFNSLTQFIPFIGTFHTEKSSQLTNVMQNEYDTNKETLQNLQFEMKFKNFKNKYFDLPRQSIKVPNNFRQISQAIVNEEWSDISSEVDTFTLPLEKYVLAKGGQPIRAMVSSIPIVNKYP